MAFFSGVNSFRLLVGLVFGFGLVVFLDVALDLVFLAGFVRALVAVGFVARAVVVELFFARAGAAKHLTKLRLGFEWVAVSHETVMRRDDVTEAVETTRLIAARPMEDSIVGNWYLGEALLRIIEEFETP